MSSAALLTLEGPYQQKYCQTGYVEVHPGISDKSTQQLIMVCKEHIPRQPALSLHRQGEVVRNIRQPCQHNSWRHI